MKSLRRLGARLKAFDEQLDKFVDPIPLIGTANRYCNGVAKKLGWFRGTLNMVAIPIMITILVWTWFLIFKGDKGTTMQNSLIMMVAFAWILGAFIEQRRRVRKTENHPGNFQEGGVQ